MRMVPAIASDLPIILVFQIDKPDDLERMKHAAKSIALIAAIACAPVASADSLVCPDSGIHVEYGDVENATLVCGAAREAEALFRHCDFPPVPEKLDIRIVEDLQKGCVGLYHCADGRIELLSPSALEDRRDPEAPFGFLDARAFFESVVIHELAHAAIGETPCPIDDCLVSDEYIAYGMQILSLSAEARRTFGTAAGEPAAAPYDDLSRIMLFLAPDRFVRAVGAHLAASDDPCAFLGLVKDREILLDRERF